MLVVRGRFLSLPMLDVWWPTTREAVHSVIRAAPTIRIMHCSDIVAGQIEPYIFWRRPVHTMLLDLRLSKKSLWQGLTSSCRYQIRTAQKNNYRILINDQKYRALAIINARIKQK